MCCIRKCWKDFEEHRMVIKDDDDDDDTVGPGIR